MECFMCQKREMRPYFKKRIGGGSHDISVYVRCEECGLVVNQTVYEMTKEEWRKVNDRHKNYQGGNDNPSDPKWIARLRTQARVICGLFRYGVIKRTDKAVDYGCGDGKLSDFILEEYEKQTGEKTDRPLLRKYDKYMRPNGAEDYCKDEEMVRGTFDFVVSCSVLEHLIGMKDVDDILALVNDEGIIAVHTLVCEEVPDDPDWFYLSPGHCTIWTNKAMTKLYEKYGYVGCAYHVEAQMWFFFKNQEKYRKLQAVYKDIPGTWIVSEHFVDYWKQKPYRH